MQDAYLLWHGKVNGVKVRLKDFMYARQARMGLGAWLGLPILKLAMCWRSN